MLTEQRVVLKQEAVSGIWIDGEQGVRQSLRQDNRVHGWDDEVIAATRNEDGMLNFSQMRVRSVFVPIPPGQGRSLSLHPITCQKRIAFAFSRLEPVPEGCT